MRIGNFLIKAVVTGLVLGAGSAVADEEVWAPAHGGNRTVAEIIAIDAEEALARNPEAVVTAEISIPLVTDGVQVVEDVSGLPEIGNGLEVHEVNAPGFSDHGTPAEGAITSARITMPFDVSQFIQNGSLDTNSMENSLAELVSNLVSPSNDGRAPGKFSGATTQGSGGPSGPNCNGYGLGSTLTVTQSLGCLGTVRNTYTCTANATGGKDWFLTDTERFSPPPESDCITY